MFMQSFSFIRLEDKKLTLEVGWGGAGVSFTPLLKLTYMKTLVMNRIK